VFRGLGEVLLTPMSISDTKVFWEERRGNVFVDIIKKPQLSLPEEGEKILFAFFRGGGRCEEQSDWSVERRIIDRKENEIILWWVIVGNKVALVLLERGGGGGGGGYNGH